MPRVEISPDKGREIVGVLFAALAVICGASLASYHPADSSFLRQVSGASATRNWIGGFGAEIGAAGFASPTDWHLAPNSAARDTGNLGVRHPGLPDLDGDGLRRVRGPSVDIGAFEYGDASFSHANPQTQTLSTVQRASLNEHPEALLHITRSDGGGGLLFFPNARPMSQSYDELAQRWNLWLAVHEPRFAIFRQPSSW